MLLQKDVVNLHLLVESDDHLIFLVTIPIHDGSNESSEISSETTAISSGTSSGTHPHKVRMILTIFATSNYYFG